MTDESNRRKIHACIVFLKSQGYEVIKRDDSKIGKWVAFRKEGLDPVQHGKITHDYVSGYNVRRKNGRDDFVGLGSVIQFFDSKEDCYAMR